MKAIALHHKQDNYNTAIEAPIINVNAKQKLKSRIIVPSMGGYELLKIADILYVSASSNYSCLHLHNGQSFTLSKTLSKTSEELIPHGFLRIHSGYLVNPEYICRIYKENQYEAVLINHVRLPISRSRKTETLDYLLDAF